MERLNALEGVLRPEQLEWLEENMENREEALIFVRDAVESKIRLEEGKSDYLEWDITLDRD